MSKALLKKHSDIWTKLDYKKADTAVERCFLYMMRPQYFENVISQHDRDYLDRLKMTHALILEHGSHSTVSKIIADTFPGISGSMAKARQYIEDTRRLFGDLIEPRPEYDRMILKEKFMRIAELAEKAEDYDTQRKCFDSIMKLEGLDKHTPEMAPPPPPGEIPTITITSDPGALNQGDE